MKCLKNWGKSNRTVNNIAQYKTSLYIVCTNICICKELLLLCERLLSQQALKYTDFILSSELRLSPFKKRGVLELTLHYIL